MATPARFFHLNIEQYEALRELEVSPVVNGKVRLRASIIRLNNAGWSAPKLATHFGRNLQSVHNDLDRFEQLGVVGMADSKATGAAPKVTPEMETFMHDKLAEDRVWNSTLLGEAVEQAFGVKVKSRRFDSSYWSWGTHGSVPVMLQPSGQTLKWLLNTKRR